MGANWSGPLTAPPGFSTTWREDYLANRVVIVHGRIFRIDEAGGLWYVGQVDEGWYVGQMADGRVPDAVVTPPRPAGRL